MNRTLQIVIKDVGETTCDGCERKQASWCDRFNARLLGHTGLYSRLPECLAAEVRPELVECTVLPACVGQPPEVNGELVCDQEQRAERDSHTIAILRMERDAYKSAHEAARLALRAVRGGRGSAIMSENRCPHPQWYSRCFTVPEEFWINEPRIGSWPAVCTCTGRVSP